jgi:hypothetical protein
MPAKWGSAFIDYRYGDFPKHIRTVHIIIQNAIKEDTSPQYQQDGKAVDDASIFVYSCPEDVIQSIHICV